MYGYIFLVAALASFQRDDSRPRKANTAQTFQKTRERKHKRRRVAGWKETDKAFQSSTDRYHVDILSCIEMPRARTPFLFSKSKSEFKAKSNGCHRNH